MCALNRALTLYCVTYRTWVNNPEAACQTAELLTRDADAPEEASGASIAPPPPSKLAAQTLGAGAKDALPASSCDAVKRSTAAMNGLKINAAAGKPAAAHVAV